MNKNYLSKPRSERIKNLELLKKVKSFQGLNSKLNVL